MNAEYYLNDFASHIKIHPRTILRAITKNVNTYWYDIHNPRIAVSEVANALSCDVKILQRVMEGTDLFLTQEDLCGPDYANISKRNFRYRKYTPAISYGRIRRYSRNQFVNEHLGRWSDTIGRYNVGESK